MASSPQDTATAKAAALQAELSRASEWDLLVSPRAKATPEASYKKDRVALLMVFQENE